MQFSNVAGLLIVYAGFCLCLAECIWEPELLRRPYQLQVTLIGIVFSLIVVFTIFVVGVATPLGFHVTGNSADYATGVSIGNIPWLPNYSPLKLLIINSSEHDYEKLDFIIKPDKPIAKITQLSGFCHLQFEDAIPMTTDMEIFHEGSAQVLFPILIATDGGYRMRCDVLPAKSSIEVVAALVTIDEKRLPPPPTMIEDVIREPLTEGSSNHVNHWFTDERNPNIATGKVFLEKPIPGIVWVYGTFRCLNRMRGKTEKLVVPDITGEAIKAIEKQRNP
jgi:hypothetical protein